MTRQEIIDGLSTLTNEKDLSAVKKAVDSCIQKLRTKGGLYTTRGADIDANPGTNEPFRTKP